MKKFCILISLLTSSSAVFAIGWSSYSDGEIVNGELHPTNPSPTRVLDQLVTVPIFIQSKTGNQKLLKRCTGTLIGRKQILTSFSCLVDAFPPNPLAPPVYDVNQEDAYKMNLTTIPSIVDIKVAVYSPVALTNASISSFGRVYKFVSPELVFSQNTNASFQLPVPNSNYQIIQVASMKLAHNAQSDFSQQRDLVIMKLASVPEIVTSGTIDPVNDILIQPFKEFFERRTNYYKNIAEIGLGEDQHSASLGADLYPDTEIMGFGLPGGWENNSYSTNLSNAPMQEWQKGYLNLKTNKRSLTAFIPSTVGHQDDTCRTNCFLYTHAGQSIDMNGDQGAPLYDLTNNDVSEQKRVMIGVASTAYEIQIPNTEIRMAGELIQGFGKRVVLEIEAARQQN